MKNELMPHGFEIPTESQKQQGYFLFKNEKEANLGLSQEVEGAMSNAINLNKLINDIINGKKLDVQVEGSLSSMIMNMDIDESELQDEEDVIDITGDIRNE